MRRQSRTYVTVATCGALLAASLALVCGAGTRQLGQADISEPNLLLPESWFAAQVEEMQQPAELQVPVAERWRFDPNAVPIMAAVWQQFVFVSYSKLDPSVNVSRLIEQQKAGKRIRPKMQHVTECRNIENGSVLWSTPGISGRFVVLPGFLLMLTWQEEEEGLELVVLDSKQGQIVRRLPFARDPGAEIARVRKISDSPLEFTEAWALDVRHDLLRPVFSGEDPAPLDMAQWTPEEARRVLDIFSSGDVEYLVRHGAIKGRFLFPDANNVVVLNTMRHLKYRHVSEDRVHWQHFCSAGTRETLLWLPPYILLFSAPTAVTAYRIEDGSPAWMYEFPADTSNGGPVHRFAALTDGILLLTEPLRGLSETEYQSLPRPEREALLQKQSRYLWLTKLDFNGNRLFQQELTMKSDYQKLALSRGHLVLWTSDTLVCYGPTETAARTVPPDVPAPLDEEQRRLEIERLHAEYDKSDPGIFERIRICGELGRLKDRSMLARVLADLAQANAGAKDIYVDALGFLNDRRAIDALIPMTKDESFSIKNKASLALRRLTGIDLFPVEWEEWWQLHRSLYME